MATSGRANRVFTVVEEVERRWSGLSVARPPYAADLDPSV
jgi:hypothetical protein